MKVPVEALLNATSAICLIPSRAGILSSEFIKLRANKNKLYLSLAAEIYGTTYAKAVESTEDSWVYYVDRSSFEPFVKAAYTLGQKSPFTFRITKEDKPQLVMSCGARKAVFQSVQEIDGYSDKADFVGKELKLTKDQKYLLRLGVKYATNDPTFAHLNCVYLAERKACLASNQLAAIVLEDAAAPMSVPLPLLLLSILDSDKVKNILVSPDFSKVITTCGFLCQLTNKKASSDFPAHTIFKNVKMASKTKRRFVLKASALLSALKRLETYIASIIRRDMTITVTGVKGESKIKLLATVPSGKFEEPVKIESPLKEDISFELLLAMLLPLADEASRLGHISVHYDDGTPFYFAAKGMQLLVSRKS